MRWMMISIVLTMSLLAFLIGGCTQSPVSGQPKSYTLEEVGKRFGISREGVRQIEQKALSKLKAQRKDRAIYRTLGGVEMMPVL